MTFPTLDISHHTVMHRYDVSAAWAMTEIGFPQSRILKRNVSIMNSEGNPQSPAGNWRRGAGEGRMPTHSKVTSRPELCSAVTQFS